MESLLLLVLALMFYVSTLIILFKHEHVNDREKLIATLKNISQEEKTAAHGLNVTINFITVALDEGPDDQITPSPRFFLENGSDELLN